MDSEDLFIVLGLVLVALALIVSFLGVRSEKFPPSRGVMLAGIGLFAALIGVTLVFAWQGAEDEQEHRNELRASGEEPTPAAVMDEMLAETEDIQLEAEGEAPAQGEAPAEDEGAVSAQANGPAIFDEQGCSGCHVLAAAGSTGTVGPDLDVALKGEDVAFIEDSIVDPEAEIEKGFPGGVMPDNFSDELTPEELDALVTFIAESVGAKSK